MILNCQVCHKEVKRTPSQLKRGKHGRVFCSHSCSATFNNPLAEARNPPKKRICNWCQVEFFAKEGQSKRLCQPCSVKYFMPGHGQVIGNSLVCKTCQRVYEPNYKKGHTLTQCNSCVVNSRRIKVKLDLVAYKGGSCQRCGYHKYVEALVFHHVDPSQKEFSISGNHALSMERLKAEVDKCELLCQNCHVETHVELHRGKVMATKESPKL